MSTLLTPSLPSLNTFQYVVWSTIASYSPRDPRTDHGTSRAGRRIILDDERLQGRVGWSCGLRFILKKHLQLLILDQTRFRRIGTND